MTFKKLPFGLTLVQNPLFLFISLLCVISKAEAQSLLVDKNGDGIVSVMAFGDSITFGVGDGVSPGAVIEEAPQTDGRLGYPMRIEALYGISVENRGLPGEEIANGGADRFVSAIRASNADVVVVLEGVNDSLYRRDAGEFSRFLQKIINVAIASDKVPVLATLQTPCCNHGGREPYTTSYSIAVDHLAFVNDLHVVDLERAWQTTCQNKEECELYNLPEGLHPNIRGYDVMAQTILATLLGIDVFAPDGAAQLEGAIGAAPGTVLVRPGGI